MSNDLSRLSLKERQALLLLAEGHTVKSAAATVGVTEGVINERLREARRKTGATSSRDLARQIKDDDHPTQKNCDEKIGMDVASVSTDPSGTEQGRKWLWPVVVGGFFVIVLIAAATVWTMPVQLGPLDPPQVVLTQPAQKAVVSAGSLEVSVTFDRPMRAGSYSFIQRDAETFPDCRAIPVQSPDKKTFSLTCAVEPGRTYMIGFNNNRHRNFRDEANDVPASPYVLEFVVR